MFPYLRDPYAKHGYVSKYVVKFVSHLFLLKTFLFFRNIIMTLRVDRGICHGELRTFKGRVRPQRPVDLSPSRSVVALLCREKLLPARRLSYQKNSVSLMKHTSEVDTVKVKMRETFQYRHKMIHDPSSCADVLTQFPRFLDIKGLVRQFM